RATLAAGATAVQLGTVLLGVPSATARVTAELDEALVRHGFAAAADAVGAAHQTHHHGRNT
ncbi:MAG: dihydroorotate dehydrogenase, partial [Nocardioidaceae bacterium]|nr:dihydroorotate dehydrogenase [Nocardioidaceae bacterium]